MPDKINIIHSPEQIVESFSRCTKNGFVTCDLNGNITCFSSSMEKITGWHEPEMIGKSVSTLYALPESISQTMDEENAKSQAAVVYKRNGQKITLPARQTTIRNSENPDKVEGYLTLFMTHKGDVDRAQSDFVSTVSHELRTPITSIKGFASTLLQHRTKLDEDKRKKYIKIIRDQADRLSRLVEDLLAVSRLESRKLQLTIQPLDIKKAVENTCTLVESKYEGSHDIHINAIKDLPTVWADSDRLEQILTNLIENAIKYSPEAEKIDINISTAEHKNEEMMKIEIIDYGIGIDAEDVEKIFTKFSRLDNPLTRTTEGTGLGLFITKSLASILKGDVLVESEEGKTTFSLYLPINPSKKEDANE